MTCHKPIKIYFLDHNRFCRKGQRDNRELNTSTNEGETPLARAKKLEEAGMRGDYTEIVKLLEEAGAE